ncbi:MAG: hypothetical protein KA191_11650 [Verrucomicrobia bacterium]|jgi:purine-cytosine permease-like protein|nr:hypothetical protein [Verrucomicrobiota bacterium]HOI37709.1 hypothetical protein [Bacillota bacterium]NMD19990.1 hypothetical protein [Verrucomicrobiota bacterium]HOR72384.1 hypothetical protein [Verrucomicrobiota bacterium]HPW82604.1 hypothetical protein [Verrucomicrobiota bacterium]
MNPRTLWARILITLGGIAMLLGAVDPLEGSLLILPGSGLIALGTFIGQSQRRVIRYWLWVFGLIAVGVAAMFVLSAFGGIGGKNGHSMWWGVLVLPYPVGWLMALVAALLALIRFLKARGRRAQA